MTANRLANETSPYLLQHAENPVHWRAWGADALTEARDTNKPILLSIGYAACHWCHVMAHESFENPDIAALMNRDFVNIKVDREERPDLDTIYQHALQLMGQQGGWPLTMFLTPAGEPFWGGTYFPPERRYGRPGFPEILAAVHRFYSTEAGALRDQVTKMRAALDQLWTGPRGGAIPVALIDDAAKRLVAAFDPIHGGIAGAPKFPNPTVLELVRRYAWRAGDAAARTAVLNSLDHMCQGGIYDHLGGGFARYATDEAWLVPHFEKMLYDNAQLLLLLTAAWRETRNPLYEHRARETADWILREMIAEGGGFAATLDADSEGEEGRFYVWTMRELTDVLGGDAAAFARVYGATDAGNWEGRNILHRNHPDGAYDESSEDALQELRAALRARRDTRVRPGWDDKVLADWNGMMIDALTDAGRTFARPDWIAAARTAYRFVTRTMQKNGRLCHSARSGRARHDATLDDYAFMSRAALALYQTTSDRAYLADAEGWFEILETHYRDRTDGAYFFTADDAETLIVRTKSAADNATPSGNAVAADTLARLYYLTGNPSYRIRAEDIVTTFSHGLTQNFFPLAALMTAAETLQAVTQIVIIGPAGAPDTERLAAAAYAAPVPNRVITVLPPDGQLPDIHPAHGKTEIDGAATAYVCSGTICGLPLTDPARLAETLARP